MLGHLIYNYSHLDDCRIQQEISKKLYAKAFGGVHLVHAYNGKKEFGYQPYLEDKFIQIKNRGHHQGAVDLINGGVEYFNKQSQLNIQYLLVTAADTWCLNVHFLQKLVREMRENNKVLATSSWGTAKEPEKPHGFAADFFVIDLAWNRKAKLWPLDYPGFVEKFSDIFYLQHATPIVESAVQFKFNQYFGLHYKDNEVWQRRNASWRRIAEREPVHSKSKWRKNAWPRLGLYTSPDGKEKQKVLKKLKLQLGPEALKLRKAKDLGYYNSSKS